MGRSACKLWFLALGSILFYSISVASAKTVPESYGKLPLSFEPNQGQTSGQVKFLSRGSGYTLFLTSTEALLALREGESAPSIVRMSLIGANKKSDVTGVDPLPGRSNYFIGNEPKKWRTGIPNYSKVRYRDAYPGVDVVYYGNQRQLEYDFIVSPGAEPRAIALAFAGVDYIAVDPSGDLVLTAGEREMRLRKPIAYQEREGKRDFIPAKYVLDRAGRVTFEVAAYDKVRTLIIDPVLIYSSYLGGTNSDRAFSMAVDSSGSAYVTGHTLSTDFPSSAGAFDVTISSRDGFLTKFDPSGGSLIYSTYLGGSGDDGSLSIAIDNAGNSYLTGTTASSDYPTTVGAFDGTSNGGEDAFVTKLNASGAALVYSTYLGGSGTDQGRGLTIDPSGNAYLTGFTNSGNFPSTTGAFDTASGGDDAFVTKLNAGGSSLVYSTFLGGFQSDEGFGIALDSLFNAYVTGRTGSIDFPTTVGAYQRNSGGGFGDVFISKLNPLGTALVYSTYLGGGAGLEWGVAIAVNSGFEAYVTGVIASGGFATTGAFQTTSGGGSDAFVAKMNSLGTALLYFTYLGGSDGSDIGLALALDADSNVYVTGATGSTNFPVTLGSFDTTANGGGDAFVSKMNLASAGVADLVYSSYLGGASADEGRGIAPDLAGDVYLAGSTGSTNFPKTAAAFDVTFNGGDYDAFITKLTPIGAPSPPEQQLTDLADLIESFDLPAGTENSFKAKVAAAIASLADGNITAACNQLQALINHAEAQSGKKLTTDEAQEIIEAAQAIRTALECP